MAPSPDMPLFVPVQEPILAALGSTTPRPPMARRKTLARFTSFNLGNLGRRSPRLSVKNRSMPIAQLVERLLFQWMGVVGEGEQLTEEAIRRFVALFQG